MTEKPILRLIVGGRNRRLTDVLEQKLVALPGEWETLAQEQRSGHRYVLMTLNEPHTKDDLEAIQKGLRQAEEELVCFSSSLPFLQDKEARTEIQRELNATLQTTALLDLRLTQERQLLLQKESKSPLTKLLFVAGFPAGAATAMKALLIRDWVIGVLTGAVCGAAVWIAYKDDWQKSWTTAAQSLCGNCLKDHCCLKNEADYKPKGLKQAVRVATCMIQNRKWLRRGALEP